MKITINLENKIVNRLKDIVKKTDEFKSIEDYIEYILLHLTDKTEEDNNISEKALSNKDDKAVEERLKNLGYLD